MIVAGTGHRPDKLGGYHDSEHSRLVDLAVDWLKLQRLEDVHQDNSLSMIISGMALGWDQALCEAAHDLSVPVTAAVPFEDQEKHWPIVAQRRYRELLSRCYSVVVVSPGPYDRWKFQKRNMYMVDHADYILALWDGSKGGTKNCVDYATLRSKPVENLWTYYKQQQREYE